MNKEDHKWKNDNKFYEKFSEKFCLKQVTFERRPAKQEGKEGIEEFTLRKLMETKNSGIYNLLLFIPLQTPICIHFHIYT